MTQIRVPTNVARTNKANTWSGTQDFSGATVLGVTGGGGAGGTVAGATSTAAGVVQLAGDLAGTYQSPTVPGLAGKADKTALAAVATSGAYGDLTGRPALAPVASSGAYTDLTGRPALAPVASSGAYTDLTGRPALAAVATSGAYADLTGAPVAPPTILTARRSTSSAVLATTAAVDSQLVFANVQPGTYAAEAFIIQGGSGGFVAVTLGGTATATATFVSAGTSSANAQSAWNETGTVNFVSYTSTGAQTTPNAAAGVVTVTAAGSVGLMARQNGGSMTVAVGSWLRLTKMA